MINTGSFVSTETMRTLGWTLAHFLWQGGALAAILWVLLGFIRSASVRYRTAVVVFVLMSAAPVVTFFWLRGQSEPVASTSAVSGVLSNIAGAVETTQRPEATSDSRTPSIDWPSCFVWAWLAGVCGFGVRAAGGWMYIERLYREKRSALSPMLARRCAQLQRTLGINRTIAYFESVLVDAPAVIGWFRPMVLLPASAISGLSPDQLDAIIVHELAHIQRLDCFVNLFQIAAETLLFYQPAVWWVSRVIRAERENCCDDMAVAICGDARAYARALTLLETWRAAPSIVLAVNSGSLKSRITRLLGLDTIVRSVPRAGLAALAVLCGAGVVVASTSFHYGRSAGLDDGSATTSTESSAVIAELRPPAPPAAPAVSPEVCPRAGVAAPSMVATAGFKRAPAPTTRAEAEPEPETAEAQDASQASATAASGTGSSYIQGLQAAGLKNISVDELIELKIQGVTPEYVREMHAAGLEPSTRDLVSMKVQGVTPDYVRQVRQAWPDASVRDIIGMKVQGVTPEYVREVRQVWPQAGLHDIIGMKVQGVTPDYIREVRQTWPDATIHDVIGMKVQGIAPDYVREVRQTWPDAGIHDIIGMKVQGVNPSDKAEFERLGLGNLNQHELIAFRVQNVTPDYVRTLESAGLGKLTPHEVISAKVQGVSPDFIREVQAHGFKNLTLHQLIALKIANVF